MKRLLLALLIVLPTQLPYDLGMGPLCVGAQHAVVLGAQRDENPERREREVPDGQWCQRAMPRMDRKAHACGCHQHDCTDPDPTHVSAHTDPQCKDYCHQQKCRCERMDCP